VKCYKAAADSGMLEAIVNYGFALENGLDGKVDCLQAMYSYKIAADNGNFQAMNNLGIALEQ
jgi:TPR repeat protein